MKNLTSKLFFLLVIQLILVAVFFLSGQQEQDYKQQNFLNLSQTSFDKIIIKEESKEITLTSKNDSWVLSDKNNLPIASTKISDVIDKLKTLKSSWPIATSKASHERFDVSENKFQRQLKLYSGDKLVSELYLGTSPGFRKLHARLKDKDEVYSLKLNHFDFSTEANDWLDKSLLASDELSSIKGTDFELVKNAESWNFAKPPSAEENMTIDEDKAKQLASALTGLTVQKIAEEKPAQVAASLEVTNSKGSLKYDFFKNDKNYFVSRNDINTVFIINQSDYEKLTQSGRANLTRIAQNIDPEPSAKEPSGELHSEQQAEQNSGATK